MYVRNEDKEFCNICFLYDKTNVESIAPIDGEVIRAKRREDWRREYMTLNILIAREKKKSEEQGRIEGITIGRNEGLSIATTNSIRAIMQTLNYSAEKAMEILKIPKSEYGRYLNLLQE